MNQKMSVFQIILLTVFGASAVAGVLIFALVVGRDNNASIGAVTIWGTFDDTAMQTVLRQLSDTDQRLKAVTYVKKAENNYEAELVNALASGTGPDLFIIANDHTIIDQPKIASIPYESFSKTQFQNTFIEGANSFLGDSGTLAIPVLADPLVLYWNKDILANAGFSQPPRYWD